MSYAEDSDNTDLFYDEMPRRTHTKYSGHTVRYGAGLPSSHSDRGAKGIKHGRLSPDVANTCLRDYKHVPITKPYGCKLFERSTGRSWLQKQRKYENHVKRIARRTEFQTDSYDFHD